MGDNKEDKADTRTNKKREKKSETHEQKCYMAKGKGRTPAATGLGDNEYRNATWASGKRVDTSSGRPGRHMNRNATWQGPDTTNDSGHQQRQTWETNA